jgi:hypothetical protein
MFTGLLEKYPLLLSYFNKSFIFSTFFQKKKKKKNTHISDFKKMRQEGAELFHGVGQTDRHDKAFRNFANAPNNW